LPNKIPLSVCEVNPVHPWATEQGNVTAPEAVLNGKLFCPAYFTTALPVIEILTNEAGEVYISAPKATAGLLIWLIVAVAP
jgi:hypothetical protein